MEREKKREKEKQIKKKKKEKKFYLCRSCIWNPTRPENVHLILD